MEAMILGFFWSLLRPGDLIGRRYPWGASSETGPDTGRFLVVIGAVSSHRVNLLVVVGII